jgi:hypothetical protein
MGIQQNLETGARSFEQQIRHHRALIMNSKRMTIAAASVIVTFALVFAWHHARLAAQARLARSELQQKRVALETSFAELKNRAASPKNPTAHSQPAAAVPQNTSADAEKEILQTFFAQLNAQEKDPKLQALYLKSNRAKTQTSFSPLYRQLRLTPSQTVSFEEIIAQRDERLQDILPIAKSLGLKLDDPAIRKFINDTNTDFHTQMRSLLGDTPYLKFVEYERSSPVRQIVSHIAGTATLADAALTPDQTERLVGIITGTSTRYAQGGWAEDIDWDIVDAQAQTFLTPKQFEVLTTQEGNGGRLFSKMNGAIAVARKVDRERAAPAQKN